MPASSDAQLIEFVRDRDVACPSCDYNLRGLTQSRCPECGEQVGLTVALVDPYATAWIVLAVMICGSAGMGLIFGCIVLRAGLPRNERGLAAIIIYYICTIPFVIPLVRGRRRFQRLSRPVQRSISGGVAAIFLVTLALLCVFLR